MNKWHHVPAKHPCIRKTFVSAKMAFSVPYVMLRWESIISPRVPQHKMITSWGQKINIPPWYSNAWLCVLWDFLPSSEASGIGYCQKQDSRWDGPLVSSIWQFWCFKCFAQQEKRLFLLLQARPATWSVLCVYESSCKILVFKSKKRHYYHQGRKREKKTQ